MTGEATGRPAALVPPRPNLGPEPFPEPEPVWPWLAGPAVAVGLLLAGLRLRRRRRRAGSPAVHAPPDAPAPGTSAGGVVAHADAVRAALVARFGATWRAKTTEEIAGDPGPAEAFGTATAERLNLLLREADRAKFSGPGTGTGEGSPGAGPQGDEADAWVAWFVAGAGARSTSNEK